MLAKWIHRASRVPDEKEPLRTPDASTDTPEILPVRHGSAAIVNGTILVTDPDDAGAMATLWITEHAECTLLRDGQPVTGEVVVAAGDTFTINAHRQAPSDSQRYIVSNDKLAVTVRRTIVPGWHMTLRDTAPSRQAIVECLETPEWPDALSVEDLKAAILHEGYQGIWDESALRTVATATESLDAIVLRGTPPKNGRPDQFSDVRMRPELDAQLRFSVFATVEAGDPIADIIPGTPGLAGVDVYGQPIAPSAQATQTQLGDGVIVVSHRVIAARSGRPMIGKRMIDVVPELVIERDVTPRDGLVDFRGNVVVKGHVLDGSRIRATGTVRIVGNVLQSVITAEETVSVSGNIVGSTITAGYRHLLQDDLSHGLDALAELLANFQREYQAIMQQASSLPGSEEKIPKIADVLLTQRHSALKVALQRFADQRVVELEDIDPEYRALMHSVRTEWTGIYTSHRLPDEVRALCERFAAFHTRVSAPARGGHTASIRAANLSTSTLRAVKAIRITGAGVFSSHVHSGNTITITGTVRGGLLHARHSVRVGELGTDTGTETSVRVDDIDGVITVGLRHPNTVLELARRKNRSVTTEHNLKIGKDALP